MPNTLAHVGAQGLLTRAVLPNADVRWIYAGLIIPDIPWMLQRIVLFSVPAVDPFVLRSYVIIQASLIGSLLLCAAVSFLAQKFWFTFAILSGNTGLHLVLDAMQTKWGNGVHFLAPMSWDLTNWGLFWPESWPTYLMTVAGFIFIWWHWRPAITKPIELARFTMGRTWTVLALLSAYLALPLLLLQAPLEADTHYLKTLSGSEDMIGRQVEMDRSRYIMEDGKQLLLYNGGADEIRVVDLGIAAPATVSVRGTFVATNTIKVDDLHIHSSWFRDAASYIGLALILILWIGALWKTRVYQNVRL